jgi:hypothetical protein
VSFAVERRSAAPPFLDFPEDLLVVAVPVEFHVDVES